MAVCGGSAAERQERWAADARRWIRHGARGASSDDGDVPVDVSSVFDSCGSRMDEATLKRLESAQFFALRQAQVGEELTLREKACVVLADDVAKLEEELLELEASVQAREQSARSALDEAEERALQEERRCAQDIMERWHFLDSREAAVRDAGEAVRTAASAYDGCADELVAVSQAAMRVSQQQQALQVERHAIADARQEVESRETALQCLQSAWGCVMEQACGDPVVDEEDLLEDILHDVFERVVEGLLLHGDPCFAHDRCLVRDVVRVSLGLNLTSPRSPTRRAAVGSAPPSPSRSTSAPVASPSTPITPQRPVERHWSPSGSPASSSRSGSAPLPSKSRFLRLSSGASPSAMGVGFASASVPQEVCSEPAPVISQPAVTLQHLAQPQILPPSSPRQDETCLRHEGAQVLTPIRTRQGSTTTPASPGSTATLTSPGACVVTSASRPSQPTSPLIKREQWVADGHNTVPLTKSPPPGSSPKSLLSKAIRAHVPPVRRYFSEGPDTVHVAGQEVVRQGSASASSASLVPSATAFAWAAPRFIPGPVVARPVAACENVRVPQYAWSSSAYSSPNVVSRHALPSNQGQWRGLKTEAVAPPRPVPPAARVSIDSLPAHTPPPSGGPPGRPPGGPQQLPDRYATDPSQIALPSWARR